MPRRHKRRELSGHDGTGVPSVTVLPERPKGIETAHQSIEVANDVGTLVTENSDRLDRTVVGRPFPVSTTIETDCKGKHEDSICADVHQHLAKLADEPRDPLWASKMEELIQSDIESTQPNSFRIRNIECRNTVCAAEVESTFSDTGVYGSYMGGMQPGHDALKAAPPKTNFNTFAYETDPGGARLTVTVITFTKR